MVKRNIGKGTIGTFLWTVGLMLCAFGVAGVDEKDDKIKIRIGDIYIDISEIYGTNSIFLGIATWDMLSSYAKKESYNELDLLGDALDQMFMDSTFSDLYNLFRNNNGVGDIVVNQVDNSLSMFIPNLVKSLIATTYVYKAQYASGILGMIERLADDILTPIAYIYPTRYDPYTGEKQLKYKVPVINDLFNRLSPVKIYAYNVSDVEKTALLYGVRKGELTGKYEDITLKSAQVSQLNEYYGKLNSKSLEKLFNNKVSYKVKDEKTNKYKTLRFSAMTDEQKKSVIERIMDDNAKFAKMYVLTSNGYKYYGTESEITYAKHLGIKNVYIQTGKKEGYVLK